MMFSWERGRIGRRRDSVRVRLYEFGEGFKRYGYQNTCGRLNLRALCEILLCLILKFSYTCLHHNTGVGGNYPYCRK
jgi:hypothetical protein